MNYLELLQAASRNMFGDNDPRSIFDFLENPNSFGVGILRAFAISTRYVFNLTRLPTLKRDLVNYATRVINDISSPYSVQNTFDMAYFIQVYGNFMSKSVPRHPQLTQQTSIRRLVPRPQQQQQQQLPPPQYPYTNPELQYMNANGPRPQVQPSIDTYYGPGQAQLLQQQAQQKPQMMFQQLQQGPIQLESLGMTKSFVYPGSDPMLFNEPEFVERQDPIYTVVKRLAASWLGTSTQKAIPNIRYTFHFSFEGEVWRSLTENGFEVHLRIFDIDKGLDVPLTADSNFVVAGSNYPLPVKKRVSLIPRFIRRLPFIFFLLLFLFCFVYLAIFLDTQKS